MNNSNNFSFIEKIAQDELEKTDFSTPTDITMSLVSALQDYYLKQKIQLFSVNLDYLIENADLLVKKNEKNHFVCYGDFTYYSPQNLDYDFTNLEKPLIEYRGKLETAIITYKNNTIPFYLHKNILRNIPEIATKSYSLYNPNNFGPIGIVNPIFEINSDDETKKLIPLILIHVDEIFEFEDTEFHIKVDTSKQTYTIPIIVN